MQVILLERVEKLGHIGDEVTVKPGFARNFLLPQGKALRATDANRQRFEVEREALEKLNAERREAAQHEADGMDDVSVMLIRQAGESGQLYGSVTARDIIDALAEQDHKIQRSQIALDTPIKSVGLHPVKIRLHAEVTVEVTVNVARTDEEAERQAAGEDVIAAQAEEDRAFADAQAAELFEAGEEAEAQAADAERAAREAEEGEAPGEDGEPQA